MKRDILFSMVRSRVWTLLNGYLDSVDELSEEKKLENVIVKSFWEEVGSGLVGAFALALDAYENKREGEVNHDDDELKKEEEEGALVKTALDGSGCCGSQKKKTRREEESEQKHFTSGVLVGIGLSFGCALFVSLLGRGLSRRRA